MADYFVKKVEVCSKCHGARMVQHPAWVEYWKENNDKDVMTLEEDRKWFEDHGWYAGAHLDIGTDGLPDEEVYCSECEGEGEIVSQVNLLEVLPELLANIKS